MVAAYLASEIDGALSKSVAMTLKINILGFIMVWPWEMD
jgi:hypothetical protein